MSTATDKGTGPFTLSPELWFTETRGLETLRKGWFINHQKTRKDKKTKKLIPAHFIQDVVCEHKGANILTAHWGGGVSKNPYLSFKFEGGAKGDELKISWTDNKGGSDSATAKIG